MLVILVWSVFAVSVINSFVFNVDMLVIVNVIINGINSNSLTIIFSWDVPRGRPGEFYSRLQGYNDTTRGSRTRVGFVQEMEKRANGGVSN